jgi:hypothetical protein
MLHSIGAFWKVFILFFFVIKEHLYDHKYQGTYIFKYENDYKCSTVKRNLRIKSLPVLYACPMFIDIEIIDLIQKKCSELTTILG